MLPNVIKCSKNFKVCVVLTWLPLITEWQLNWNMQILIIFFIWFIKIVMGLSKTCFAVFHNFDDIPSNPNLDWGVRSVIISLTYSSIVSWKLKLYCVYWVMTCKTFILLQSVALTVMKINYIYWQSLNYLLVCYLYLWRNWEIDFFSFFPYLISH